jgi:UDP:flavonoid glycosyltransferase YjiC (YdhE family)
MHPDVFDIELQWPFASNEGRLTTPLLLACSPTVISRPDDWSASHIHIPGYFFLDAVGGYQPSAALTDFLVKGESPVCVTFGSMIHRDAARIHRVVIDAISRSGNRGLILSGWGGLQTSSLPENIYVAESVPHDWLFPHCKAVIHHGGAGTTGAGGAFKCCRKGTSQKSGKVPGEKNNGGSQ